jgi:hypothetical protein
MKRASASGGVVRSVSCLSHTLELRHPLDLPSQLSADGIVTPYRAPDDSRKRQLALCSK